MIVCAQTAVCALVLLSGVMEAAQRPMATGYLSGYDRLPTDATIQYRQERGHIPLDLSEFDALVAVLDCAQIGESGVLLTAVGALDVLVFDCAGRADGGYQWMVDNSMVAELDWYARRRWPGLMGSRATLILDMSEGF